MVQPVDGASPPTVFRRWTKVVSASSSPAVGPSSAPTTFSNNQGIASGCTVTEATANPQTLLVSRESCHVTRGVPFSIGLGLRKWVIILTLDSAPAQPEVFAITVVKGATTKVVTGAQNIDAVLAAIKPPPTTVPTAAPTTPVKGPTKAVAGTIWVPALVDSLQKSAVAAESLAKQINDAWGTLSACTPPSS